MIYLDNAATTCVDVDIVDKMSAILKKYYGNPASIHKAGRESKILIDEAKEKIAEKLRCSSSEIFFTSGATESNNWAIIAIFEMMKDKGNHIIASAIEHESVLKTLDYLKNERGARITLINPERNGRINSTEIREAITDTTVLICLMYVNNETGVIQPIEEVSEIANKNNICLHCDAVQALGKINVDIDELKVSTMSFSAHKIHGIKGSGLLYIKDGIRLKSFIHGGMQQNSRRAGTENTIAPILFDMALEKAINIKNDIKQLKQYFINRVMNEIEDVVINGDEEISVDNIINISINGTDSEDVLIALDMNGIYASAGSACTSGSIEASYVLKAMGISYAQTRSAVRFSFSKYNTIQEIDITVDKLKEIITNLREFDVDI